MASNLQLFAVKYASQLFDESLFLEMSSVVHKCPLRRLISENTKKTISSMAWLAFRKID